MSTARQTRQHGPQRPWSLGDHLELALALLAVPPHVARRDTAHNLCQGEAALLAALALPAQQRAEQAALICQPLLVILRRGMCHCQHALTTLPDSGDMHAFTKKVWLLFHITGEAGKHADTKSRRL